MRDIMIDLETTSTCKTGAAIVAIGAVHFDILTGEVGDYFYRVVSRDSCKKLGLTESKATLDWWSEQPEDARKVLSDPNAVEIKDMVNDFYDWCHNLKNPKGYKVSPQSIRPWGNSSDFDLSILQAAFEKLNKDWPFLFWEHRDIRTVFGFIPFQTCKDWQLDNQRPGTYHNAVDDCKYQIRMLKWAIDLLGVKYYR